MYSSEQIDTALAIADLAEQRLETLRTVQGHLLQAGVDDRPVTPRTIAKGTGISPSGGRDLCRQLESSGAAEQFSTQPDPLDSEYRCDEEAVTALFETAVFATKVLSRDRERRQTPTTVQPLATLPADPSFDDVTPEEYGFRWLMPSLSNAINQTTDHVRILMPFFEQDGFEKLEPALMAALERGVSVTIVARYLSDSSSHNRHVLSAFVENCRENGVRLSNLNLVDYTYWDADSDSGQNGDQPSFTLHAKVMVFDADSAYIGSANVTDYGFERYLELGVLIEGPDVRGFDRIVSRLLESPAATEVQL